MSISFLIDQIAVWGAPPLQNILKGSVKGFLDFTVPGPYYECKTHLQHKKKKSAFVDENTPLLSAVQ